MGCTGKRFKRKLRMLAGSKLNGGEITLYWIISANTCCQGPLAGKCNLRDKMQGKRDIWNRRNGWWLTAIPGWPKGSNHQPAELRVSCLIVNGRSVVNVCDARLRIG